MAKVEAWKVCRKNLLPIIASNLSEAIHDEWVIATTLLPTQLLPAAVSIYSFNYLGLVVEKSTRLYKMQIEINRLLQVNNTPVTAFIFLNTLDKLSLHNPL